MDMKNLDIQALSLKEKAELVVYLTKDIISEVNTDSFQTVSKNNKRIAGLIRSCRSMYVANAGNLQKAIQKCDC